MVCNFCGAAKSIENEQIFVQGKRNINCSDPTCLACVCLNCIGDILKKISIQMNTITRIDDNKLKTWLTFGEDKLDV